VEDFCFIEFGIERGVVGPEDGRFCCLATLELDPFFGDAGFEWWVRRDCVSCAGKSCMWFTCVGVESSGLFV
jgi:hypothetical protein